MLYHLLYGDSKPDPDTYRLLQKERFSTWHPGIGFLDFYITLLCFASFCLNNYLVVKVISRYWYPALDRSSDRKGSAKPGDPAKGSPLGWCDFLFRIRYLQEFVCVIIPCSLQMMMPGKTLFTTILLTCISIPGCLYPLIHSAITKYVADMRRRGDRMLQRKRNNGGKASKGQTSDSSYVFPEFYEKDDSESESDADFVVDINVRSLKKVQYLDKINVHDLPTDAKIPWHVTFCACVQLMLSGKIRAILDSDNKCEATAAYHDQKGRKNELSKDGLNKKLSVVRSAYYMLIRHFQIGADEYICSGLDDGVVAKSSGTSGVKSCAGDDGASKNDNTKKNTPKNTLAPKKRLIFMAEYRAILILMTLVAICAVDFEFFPKEFSKTLEYGYSHMDVGVGSFIFCNGICGAAKIIRSISQSRSGPASVSRRLNQIVKDLQSSLPVMIIGLGRIISVGIFGLYVSLEEYGVHWNFFFSIFVIQFGTLLVFPHLLSTISFFIQLFSQSSMFTTIAENMVMPVCNDVLPKIMDICGSSTPAGDPPSRKAGEKSPDKKSPNKNGDKSGSKGGVSSGNTTEIVERKNPFQFADSTLVATAMVRVSQLHGIAILATVELLLYQFYLSMWGGYEYLFHTDGPRESFFAANREGIASTCGMLGVFWLGVWIGQSDLTKFPLIKFALLLGGFVKFLDVINGTDTPSRRVCNMPYALYVVSVNCWLLGILRHFDHICGTLSSGRKISHVLGGLQDSMLAFFFLGNVMTGAINVTVYTLLLQYSAVALIICFLYCVAWQTTAFVFHWNGKTVKFW